MPTKDQVSAEDEAAALAVEWGDAKTLRDDLIDAAYEEPDLETRADLIAAAKDEWQATKARLIARQTAEA